MSPQGYQAINPVLVVLGPAEFANGDRAKGFSINTTVSHTLQANSLWGASTPPRRSAGKGPSSGGSAGDGP